MYRFLWRVYCFNACRINLLAIYCSISRCVWRAFSLISIFCPRLIFELWLFVVPLVVGCMVSWDFQTVFVGFARIAVILARFANVFASFHSCSCNFAIWFSIWLSCLVNSFSIFCTLSLSTSSYDLSWYCMTLGTNGPTDTEISATTARVISRVSRLSVWMSVTFPCVV